ncbi:MAG: hypothetical protein NVS9B12_07950 [Vulcanimicrobiaceae bacterium]
MDELIGLAVEAFAATAKKKAAQQRGAAPDAGPPVAASPRVRTPVPPAKGPEATAHDKEEARALIQGSGPLSGLFEDGNSLVRAVVAAELLGPPIALRENQLWQIRRPNERST